MKRSSLKLFCVPCVEEGNLKALVVKNAYIIMSNLRTVSHVPALNWLEFWIRELTLEGVLNKFIKIGLNDIDLSLPVPVFIHHNEQGDERMQGDEQV